MNNNILPSFSLFNLWIKKSILHLNEFTQQLGREQAARLGEQIYTENDCIM